MKKLIRTTGLLIVAALISAFLAGPHQAAAADAASINREARAALQTLYDTVPAAKMLGGKAKAILIFPDIFEAGLMVGSQYGDGVLLVDGKSVAYYNIAVASYGRQAGMQEFSYAMFLMTDSARTHIDKSGGWEVGFGPGIVVLDEGAAKSLTTTTAKDDVYAFIFGQKGLKAGIGVKGSKITRINP